MTDAFKRLTVNTHFSAISDGKVLVSWALDRSFNEPGPYRFTLQRGYAANDDQFVTVSTTTDQPWLYDNAPVFPQRGDEVFYRVILVDGNGRQYVSQAAPLSSYWNRYDWSLAKEIVRKETLVLKKRAGVRGWLLKRRLWGDECPVCVDPETKQIKDANCPVCYGTGITGGYYDPFEYWVIMNPTNIVRKLDNEMGLISQSYETVRALAYPLPEPNDVWVNHETDRRYVIQSDIQVIARHRGIDLVLSLRLEERAKSEAIYKVPIPC